MELNKRALILVLAGVVFGLFWFVVVRGLFFYPEPVHYHANFAVFIDGERQTFQSPIYYEEVQACTQEEHDNPRGRVHLHQPNNDVVHVHDDAVTWGNFFENLGWSLGDTFIRTDSDMYINDAEYDLAFILNGESTRQIANRHIHDEDRLLISYGTELPDEVLNERFSAIPANASEFNETYDPAGCSGSADPSILERLRYGITG